MSVPPEQAIQQQTTDRGLDAERSNLARIRQVQDAHIQRAVKRASQLAAEAAEMTEEGIRDIYDEDAEADAAVQAALVRQTSERAMHAVRRVNELQSAGSALAFGHTVDEFGEPLYVGRLTVVDDDEPLLVDWRAPAAVPFYQATPLERMGVERRRNLVYGDAGSADEGELVSYSDEIFDPEDAVGVIGLRGEAALLASVAAPTREQMRSVVATIQAEQDAIVRADSKTPLVVQGGPGTGKTVVALHRAAFLLYAQREALSDTGVLIVGPTSEFLRYIAGVLPSLGETGVISVTAPELYPGVRRGRPEADAVARVKGKLAMASLLSHAVDQRQRKPSEPLVVWYGARRVTLPTQTLHRLFDTAKRHTTHNEGADVFRFELIEALAAEVFDPSFHNRDDARGHFRRSHDVRAFLYKHWPPLTPEQTLNDLFGSRALLRASASATDLTDEECEALYIGRASYAAVDQIKWSYADIPLLDELLELVGTTTVGQRDDERIIERDEADEFEIAERRDSGVDSDLAQTTLADVSIDELEEDDISVGLEGDPLFDASVLDERFEPAGNERGQTGEQSQQLSEIGLWAELYEPESPLPEERLG